MIVLGIDPGCIVCGFALMEKRDRKVFILDYGYIKMPAKKPLPERLVIFHDHFEQMLKKWPIDTIALETPFLGKNAQNFLKLGYLRGILYLLAQKHNVKTVDLSPREIKKSVTGYGGADKDQVARVILQFFPKLSMPEKLDVTDALAITLCGVWHKQHNI
ncbi:MAG TPA: crossover junction endodeoxyribonuclease RuvC [Candidatus Babeliales bacterium]|nr:crossover junction endodeoxyribonuclease RuvC [Candidatus Babeliales bacterium]